MHYEPPFRAHRIHQLLTSKEKLTPGDMQRFQGDVKSLFAERVVREVLKPVLKEEELGESLPRNALVVLYQWDFHCREGSIAAGLFQVFYFHLVENLLYPWLG